jgi:phosphomannomutase/phosphoglucomutase
MTRLFGTNGIRGVINQDLTGELALGVGSAWGSYLKTIVQRPRVAIGTDARLSSTMLRSAVAAGLLATGCDIVDVGLVPTPTLQYTVKEQRYDSGVIITASHNPPQFNGIKGVASDGTEFSKDAEEAIEEHYFSRHYAHSSWTDVGTYTTWDGAIDLYIKGILSIVDVALIKKQRFHVVLDCGNGVGSLVAPRLLKKLGCTVAPLFCTPDGTFPGRNSEPTPENLTALMKIVPEKKASLGFAQDGDADRAIFVDEHGRYVSGDQSLSLIGKYITKETTDSVVVTPVTTSTCLEDVIKANDGRVIYTKVGSPIVARVMMAQHAVFGGEENGGLIFPKLQYCRDSAMTCAKLLEILAREQRPLFDLIAEIPHYEMLKMKMACPNDKKEQVMNELAEEMKDTKDVVRIDRTDGVKLFVKKGWVLMRPSGTEPIFRIYVETKNTQDTQRLAATYKDIVERLIARA